MKSFNSLEKKAHYRVDHRRELETLLMYMRFINCARAPGATSLFKKQARLIYLHRGSRVAGLKRDPKEVFTVNGQHEYGKDEKNLKFIKDFLEEKYRISDDLVLQVLTHKSFGNGIKPYNEKLTAMGSKLLNLFCARTVTDCATNNENAINGKNLDCLGSPIAKELPGSLSLALFARHKRLNSILFWKSYNYHLSFEASGEMKVTAQMVYALIGAVNFVHGKDAAESFIREKFFDTTPSIEDITAQIIEQSNQA